MVRENSDYISAPLTNCDGGRKSARHALLTWILWTTPKNGLADGSLLHHRGLAKSLSTGVARSPRWRPGRAAHEAVCVDMRIIGVRLGE